MDVSPSAGPALLLVSSGVERRIPPLSAPPPAQPQMGRWGRYLLLVQGQVQERPAAQRLRVARLSPQHRVEVEHGRLLPAQEPVTAGASEQGLICLTPWRKRGGIRMRPRLGTARSCVSARIQHLLHLSWCPKGSGQGCTSPGATRELTDPRHQDGQKGSLD